MTSKQVLLTLVLLFLSACVAKPKAEPLSSPYASRQIWAIAPIQNESGHSQANGHVIADHLARQLENASQIDVLPVNRVLAVMESQGMTALRSPGDVQLLLRLLGADYLVVGTVTAYDPYDPPKLGMAIELYSSPRVEEARILDLKRLSGASTDRDITPAAYRDVTRPVSIASGYFDAADPGVREKLQRYGQDRSQQDGEASSWRLYRINMNLYCEFVSYVLSWRLLEAEKQRFTPPATQPASP
jgi:hypothetical protein